ncbi:MAG TPA: hypothetical protein VFQ38_08360, partial [Longimicrobiales bacterium]|nr:hypothetical protein [Longimicrobiales bacterium]
IVAGIPRSTHSYVHVVRQDPVRKGLLYAGTENALYVSFDDGESWKPLNGAPRAPEPAPGSTVAPPAWWAGSLPHAPVYGVVVQPRFDDLVVATYGRGFWILDDVTPLQQLTPEVQAKDAHLFAPRDAWRLWGIDAPMAVADDPTVGQNPPPGASINFWLKADAKDSIPLTILDAAGKTVRTLKVAGKAGINRAWWDLRFDPTKQARLWTAPENAPWVPLGKDGYRTAPDVGRIAILAPPGTYTVKLAVNGQEQTQPLVVRKDPNAGGSEAEIAQQMELLRDLRADLDTVVAAVNGLELVRGQLQGLKRTLAADSTVAAASGSNRDLRTAADSLDAKIRTVEEAIVQLRITGRGQDLIRSPSRLGFRLQYLADQVGSSDFAPTAPQREVHKLLHDEAMAVRTRYEALMKTDVPAFNERLRARGAGSVVAERQ